MYAKTFVVAFSLLFVSQADASAQLLRLFRAPRTNSNCCQNQAQSRVQVQSQNQVQVQSEVQFQNQVQFQSQNQVQTQLPTQYQPQSSQLAPVEIYQPTWSEYQAPSETQIVGESVLSADSVPSLDAQPYQVQPEIQPQMLPFESATQGAFSTETTSPPQYGSSSHMPYSTVEGNLPIVSELTLPEEVSSDAGSPTVVGQSFTQPLQQSMTVEFASPTISLPAGSEPALAQPVPAMTQPVPALAQPAPAVTGNSGANETSPRTVIETHTIAPVTADEPAPAMVPGQIETEISEEASILDIKN